MDYWDAENTWYRHAPVSRLAKAIAQYELTKSALAAPGAIAEFGVFRATSLVRLATYRDLLEPDVARPIYGFDAFGSFPKPADERDSAWVEGWEQEVGTGSSRAEIAELLGAKGFQAVELVEGDIRETLGPFLEARPDLRFALVNVDVDVEDVTRAVLDACAGRIAAGGLFMLDDYGKVDGATGAVETFAASHDDFTLVPPQLPHGAWSLRRTGGGT